MDYLAKVNEEFDELVRLRRHFHENPECGPAEQLKTLEYIENELDKLAIRHVRIAHGGILGFIDGKKEGKTILLRSDTDALPIQEDPNNLVGPKVCVSKTEGVSHACGHDSHMAMLLVAAKLLKQQENKLKGRVILMFEESEEIELECEQICTYIQENDIHIDACYGSHVRWDIPVGKVMCSKEIAMHGLLAFEVHIQGLNGHGSRPDLGHSTLDCFNLFYNSMNQIRMKMVAPDKRFTWSIGKVTCGTARNVIPDHLYFAGTARFSDMIDGRNCYYEMKKMLDAACSVCNCSYTLNPAQFLLPVQNYEPCVSLAEKCISNLGKDILYKADDWMASETFNYLSNMYPSIYTFIGIKNDQLGSGDNHHTPKFDLDEKGMIYGVATTLSYVEAFLENPPNLSEFKKVSPTHKDFISFVHTF
ncbi:MAG: amidohydrolase [Treponema sp.]|nr:amidohydrolase [Treponema sp.]